MRKRTIVFAVLAVLALLCAGAALGEDAEPTLTLTADRQEINVGESVKFTFVITDVTPDIQANVVIWTVNYEAGSKKAVDQWYTYSKAAKSASKTLTFSTQDKAVEQLEATVFLYRVENGNKIPGATESVYVTINGAHSESDWNYEATVTIPETIAPGAQFSFQTKLESAVTQDLQASLAVFGQTNGNSTPLGEKSLGTLQTGNTYTFTANAPTGYDYVFVEIRLEGETWSKSVSSNVAELKDAGGESGEGGGGGSGTSAREKIESFVQRCYSLILNRAAEAAGLSNWSGQLETGAATAAQIVSGFMNSQEYIVKENSHGDTVEVLYNTMLNRGSDPAGKAGWVDYLDSGCSSNAVINGFCGSAEFTGLCGEYGITAGSAASEARDLNKNVTAFVSRCYQQALNREGDAGGLNTWCTALLGRERTPKEVAWGFVNSPEMTNRNLSNGELVDMLYRLYLGREADAAGRADWVNALENGMTLEQLSNGFADSGEFREIVESYGLGD